jgi:hypothetical protein
LVLVYSSNFLKSSAFWSLSITMTSQPVTRHDTYYFEDGSIIIQVWMPSLANLLCLIKFQQAGNKLYQLYQKLLCQKSGVFETMLSLPQPGQKGLISGNYREFKENASRLNLDGSSDEKALVLPHSAEEFDHLLSFIHPLKCVFKIKV